MIEEKRKTVESCGNSRTSEKGDEKSPGINPAIRFQKRKEGRGVEKKRGRADFAGRRERSLLSSGKLGRTARRFLRD